MATALRVLRLAPSLPPKSRFRVLHFASSVRGGACIGRGRHLVAPAASVWSSTWTTCDRRLVGCDASRVEQVRRRNVSAVRSFGGGGGDEGSVRKSDSDAERPAAAGGGWPVLVYEGPFSFLLLKLKRISLLSAAIAIVGLPGLSLAFGSAESIPGSGKLAVIATAAAASVGSTALLSYCFSPYVHTVEVLPPRAGAGVGPGVDGDDAGATEDSWTDGRLARIVTHDILSRRVETVFDPSRDVSPPPGGTSRPFCNFMARGMPMYVHPELIRDYGLRVQLVGEEPQQKGAEERNREKREDDEFL